jgi:MFS family permease
MEASRPAARSMIRKFKLPVALASLEHPNFRLFWIFQLVSLIGIWMQITAQGWLVYELTSSKFLLGVINAIGGLPILFLSPFGGIIADHFNRKKLLFFTQIAFSTGAFLIGILISTKIIDFRSLAVIAFCGGIVNAIDSPARMAFIVELIDIKSLGNAIALNSLGFNIARVIGPATAGYLVGAIGIDFCFYLNGVAFIPAIGCTFILKGDFSAKAGKKSSVKEALWDGGQYILGQKKVFYSLVLVAVTSTFIMPFAILMPVYAKDILKAGAKGLGTLMAFSGFGAFLGAFLLAQFGQRLDFVKFIYYSSILVSGALLAFSFSTQFAWSCFFLALLGMGIVVLVASINTYIQGVVPNELRGRVMSFYTLFFMGFMPIGAFQAGIVSHYIGAPLALSLGAVILLVPIFVMLFRKRLG